MGDVSWTGRAELFTEFVGAEVSQKRRRPPAYAAIQQPEGKSRGGAEDREELERSGPNGPWLCGRFGGSAEEADHYAPKSHQCSNGKEEEPTEEGCQPRQQEGGCADHHL